VALALAATAGSVELARLLALKIQAVEVAAVSQLKLLAMAAVV
jgi:hypothetical protein